MGLLCSGFSARLGSEGAHQSVVGARSFLPTAKLGWRPRRGAYCNLARTWLGGSLMVVAGLMVPKRSELGVLLLCIASALTQSPALWRPTADSVGTTSPPADQHRKLSPLCVDEMPSNRKMAGWERCRRRVQRKGLRKCGKRNFLRKCRATCGMCPTLQNMPPWWTHTECTCTTFRNVRSSSREIEPARSTSSSGGRS